MPTSSDVARDAHRLFRDADLEPALVGTLDGFARFAREELEPVAFDVDRRSRPYLLRYDIEGHEVDEVRLSGEHRRVLDRVYASGVATGPVEGRHDWAFSFALLHEVADVGLACSATVTVATVFEFTKYADPDLRERFGPPLLDGGGRAQGATWATEAQGGSDLGANLTVAREGTGGRWALTGEKYFCSNVGAAFALLTARPEGAPDGTRGIRLFFAPARRSDGRPNWRVRRLKEKLGTVSVPTGEVSLDGTEAYPLGPTEAGVLPVMEMLNVSRVANAVGSAAVLHRAFELAQEHANRRLAFGRPIAGHPLLAADLATLATEADAASLLAFDAVHLFDRVGSERPRYSADYHRLRLATHAAKLVCAEAAVRGTELALEVVGGPGYLEEFPVAKLARDAHVTPIWEGGANLQALDAREAIERYHPEAPWREEARGVASRAGGVVREFLVERLGALDAPGEESDAKAVLRAWAELRQGTLLAERARLDGDRSGRPEALAQLFVHLREGRPAVGLPRPLVEAVLGRAP